MKKTIKLFATQIPYIEEGLEENEVYVEFNVGELLDQIESSDIYDYAVDNLNLVNEDEIKSVEDFDDDELVEALKYNYYNFAKEVGEEEMIEYLEERGYVVDAENRSTPEYDYVDSCLFDDISNKFNSLDCFSRQKMRDLIINL